MSDSFLSTFGQDGGSKELDEALQDIEEIIFDDSLPHIECGVPAWKAWMQDISNYRNL